ncbi:MAG: HVO_0476 family zinc finger protein, partial [Thermoplasmatota archaeon]
FTICEKCGEETPHRVLKGRIGPSLDSGFDGTVQCVSCRTVHHANFPVEKPVKVNSVISDGDRSDRTQIEFGPLEEVMVGQEFFWESHNLLVTSIEQEGRRVGKAKAKEIGCLWLKVYDTVQVKVSIVRGQSTKSEKVEAAPEEEFAVGDILEFGRDKVVIDKIKTERRMIYREGVPVEARDIKRVYAKIIKERRY